jgi:hypothetical protein
MQKVAMLYAAGTVLAGLRPVTSPRAIIVLHAELHGAAFSETRGY